MTPTQRRAAAINRRNVQAGWLARESVATGEEIGAHLRESYPDAPPPFHVPPATCELVAPARDAAGLRRRLPGDVQGWRDAEPWDR